MAVAGMGAIPFDGGVAFRVWAPNAAEVRVMGTFNSWSADSHPLGSEGNGYWYGEVQGAKHGDEYKYVLRHGDEWLDRVDPYARQMTNSVGNGIVYDHNLFDWQGDNFSLRPHNELVIYEMHVGSYTSSWGGPGTFDLMREKIGHLVELGVNVVQLMPVMEFAGDRSWGYNPAHIFAVESSYGGPDGLKNFVKECHAQGIGVTLDVVYNHFGPSDLDLWRFDGWSENDRGGIYFYNDQRAETPWGATRPDYGRPEVRQFIFDNAMSWLRDYHIDGLRYDMTPWMTSTSGTEIDLPEGWDLMRWVNGSIREQFPDAILIAEDFRGLETLTGCDEGGALFHAEWDAHFVHPVREALTEIDDHNRSITEIRDAVMHTFGEPFSRVIYTESHDEVANGRARVPYEVDAGDSTGWAAQKRSTLGAALVFTGRGIPLMFQGQEFLEGEWFRDDVPLDWSNNEEFRGLVRLYRDLIRLRRNWQDNTRGLRGGGVDVIHTNDDANVIAYHRWDQGGPRDSVVVVVNLAATEIHDYRIGMPSAGTWKLRFNSDARDYSDRFGGFAAGDIEAYPEGHDNQPAHAVLAVGPYSVQIYSQD